MKYIELRKKASLLPIVAHPYGESIVAQDGRRLCSITRQGEPMSEQEKANCALIVHSVNKFPALLDTLRQIMAEVVECGYEEGTLEYMCIHCGSELGVLGDDSSAPWRIQSVWRIRLEH